MIRNKEDFAAYLKGWGCPDDEIDEVIGLCMEDWRICLIAEEELDDWLELQGYLITEVRWHND